MAREVKLRHVLFKNDQVFAFYDGILQARSGVLTLPADRLDWVRRAWVSGYSLSPVDGKRLVSFSEVEAEIDRQNAESVHSAKSAEDISEDSGTGRQSKAKNRVRESQPTGSASVSGGGSRSRGGRSPNDGQAEAEG